MLVRSIVLVLCLTGCADPRDEFVGEWAGTVQRQFRFDNSRTATLTQSFSVIISAPDGEDTVALTTCSATARMNNGDIRIQPATCPPDTVTLEITEPDDTTCTLSEVLDSGRLSVSGDTLTGPLGGLGTVSGCSNAAASSYHFTWQIAATRG